MLVPLLALVVFAQDTSRALGREAIGALADSAFRKYVTRYPEPSLALIVVARDSVLFARGYGYANAQSRVRVTPDSTVFNIASLSKLITATAVMQQVESGKLSLDEDISRYLDIPVSKRINRKITLRHLLTHMSGLDSPFMRDVVAQPAGLYPLREYFRRRPPLQGSASGRAIRYSNYGMALAGHLVEIASQTSFADYVERHIFAPLHMTHSSFRQPPPARLARSVATAGAGPVPDALLLYPAGSMVSTAADMGTFMRAHLRADNLPDQRILSARTMNEMHARQWSADPRMPGVALGFFESDMNGRRALFHTGARTHFSLMYLLPAEGIGIFVVHSMRQGGEFQHLRTSFVQAFLNRFFPDTTQLPPQPADPLRRAGVYRPNLLSGSTIERAAWLGLDTKASVATDGTLSISLPQTPTIHAPNVAGGLYRVQRGSHAGLTFKLRADRDPRGPGIDMSGNTQDPVSFDKLHWYQRGVVHLSLIAACFVVYIAWLFTSVIAACIRFVRRAPAVRSPAETWASRAGTLASFLIVAGPLTTVALVALHSGEDTTADGLRFALTCGLGMLLAGIVVGLGLIPLAILAWQRRYWTRTHRIAYAILALASFILAPALLHYHLLGFWF